MNVRALGLGMPWDSLGLSGVSISRTFGTPGGFDFQIPSACSSWRPTGANLKSFPKSQR